LYRKIIVTTFIKLKTFIFKDLILFGRNKNKGALKFALWEKYIWVTIRAWWNFSPPKTVKRE